jgi:hypothetical protein
MTAIYTFDIVCTLDGFASFDGGDWGGFWGKHGPELLDHRYAQYREEQRLVLGANTYRQFVELLGPSPDASELDPLNARMVSMPTTVVSTSLEEPLADLRGRGRLRPRVAREPDARRPHPGAHLPAEPASLSGR